MLTRNDSPFRPGDKVIGIPSQIPLDWEVGREYTIRTCEWNGTRWLCTVHEFSAYRAWYASRLQKVVSSKITHIFVGAHYRFVIFGNIGCLEQYKEQYNDPQIIAIKLPESYA